MNSLIKKISTNWKNFQVDRQTTKLLKNYNLQKFDAIKRQLNSEVNYNNINIEGYSPIFFVIAQGDKDLAEHIIKQDYFRENYLESNENQLGLTPISFSLINIQYPIFTLLSHAGAKLTTLNKGSNSLLHVASMNKNLECIDYGLKGGIDINLQNDEGNTAIHYGC